MVSNYLLFISQYIVQKGCPNSCEDEKTSSFPFMPSHFWICNYKEDDKKYWFIYATLAHTVDTKYTF